MSRWLLVVFGFFVASARADIAPLPPKLGATAYILVDFNSGQIIVEMNSEQRIEPASLTKMMGSYVIHRQIAAGRLKPSDLVKIGEKAWRTGGSRMFVDLNSTVTIENLLKGVIIQSGNDAMVALAEHVAGSEENFVSMMNQYAKQLGMYDTNFQNATGLPHPEHYSTAKNMATLSRAIIRDFPEEYRLYSEKSFSYNGITQQNRNKLLWQDQYVDGIKTGHTETAGFCLSASALKDNMRLIAIVFGTRSESARATETQKLLTYGFRFYETHKLYSVNEPLAKPRVWKGSEEHIAMGLSQDLFVTIPKGRYKDLRATVSMNSQIVAPVTKGDTFGSVNILFAEKPFVERKLVALNDISESGLIGGLLDQIQMLFE